MEHNTPDWAERLTVYALNLLAFILLASLPGLWVAWTPAMLVGVLLTGIAAAVLYCVLYAALEAEPATRDGGRAGTPPSSWGEGFAGEASDLGPFVHHNRHPDNAAFRERMQSLVRRHGGRGDGREG